MIEADRLSKHFGSFKAVDDLSFEVRPGEVLGFLGPNGAGKSTTMKMLTGFLRPTSGIARINGFDVQRNPIEAKQQIGYLPEGAPAWGDMTVKSFLKFIAQVRGLRGREAKAAIDTAIETVELEEVLHRQIDNLSKGFTRRVGLAQALLHNPNILIMDEPTDGLDPNQKHQVRELITRMAEDKLLIISTHILEEVEAVCTRAMIISDGKMMADGTPAELTARSKFHQAVTLHSPEAAKAAELLKVLPQARNIALEGNAVTVFPREGDEAGLYDLVAKLAREHNWPITELARERGRLDEVFRDITRPSAKAAWDRVAA